MSDIEEIIKSLEVTHINDLDNEKFILVSDNKGSGAGGSNTNYYGKQFESNTENESKLLENGYHKIIVKEKSKSMSDSYLIRVFEDKTVIFVLQNGLKTYMKRKYGLELFRCPDEAYIIEYNDGREVLNILEKKEQRSEGSVETKLWSGPSLKREYELVVGCGFIVNYGFCVNDFLKKKLTSNKQKYFILNKILSEHNIKVLFGDDSDYFKKLNLWYTTY